MKNLYADTNALVSFLVQRSADQSKVLQNVIDDAQQGKVRLIVIPEILLEVSFVLKSRYLVQREDVYESLMHLVSSTYLEITNRAVFLDALEIFKETNMALLDIYLYLVAKKDNGEVLSFDRDLDKLRKQY